MRRYDGNSGRSIHVPDEHGRKPQNSAHNSQKSEPVDVRKEEAKKQKAMPPPSQIGSGLQNILSNIFAQGFEVEDLLLFAVLFLMYQETGDKELLIIMGGMFLL